MSKVDAKWAEWFHAFYSTSRLDSIKKKLKLCAMCSTYFRQSHYYKTKDVQFLDLFKETDHGLVQPLSYYMFREGMFKTVLYIFENDIKEIIYNL